jgi:YihY family inner membrane protein
MSTAAVVPETWELTGDDAVETLRRCGRGRLLVDAFMRLRRSDGFSHARSLAFALSLVFVQGVIAVVGFASASGRGEISEVIVRSFEGLMPGPAGTVLTDAVDQAREAGASRSYAALAFGLVGALLAGATAMAQLERGLNRLYGVEKDRPTVLRYGRALLLTVTAGMLSTLAFIALAFGRTVGESIDNSGVASTWSIVRWPLGLGLILLAMSFLFRWCPRRHQPAWSWLSFGAAVSVALWTLVTLALGVFFHVNDSFGDTYGPLAGMLALLLWAFLSSAGILYGAAVAAQLEAVRAGASAPEDAAKDEHPPVVDDAPLAAAG